MIDSTGTSGVRKLDLETPALLVDVPAMRRNIDRMADGIIGRGVNWRPHSKAHKIPAIAHLELKAGAIGVTCAKLGEAEVMASAGISDILIANQIVGPVKVSRLVNLLPYADIAVAVDSEDNADELDRAAQTKGVTLRVLIEVDIGMRRCGVQPGEDVLRLAEKIGRCAGLRLAGLMAWESHCLFIPNYEEKRSCIESAVKLLTDSAELCRSKGFDIEIVSCGGTGTYAITAGIPGITEIQAGGGVFNDVFYADRCRVSGHDTALTLLSTVVSRPTGTRIVVDAGMKALSFETAIPRPIDLADVLSVSPSAEHGVIELSARNHSIAVGDKVEFIVGYSDTTVFLHDQLYGINDGRVEAVWPVLGRGKIQ